jgi:hypothetical protein
MHLGNMEVAGVCGEDSSSLLDTQEVDKGTGSGQE